MCEKSIVYATGHSVTAAQIAYQLEMCEELFLNECKECGEVMQRSDFNEHLEFCTPRSITAPTSSLQEPVK